MGKYGPNHYEVTPAPPGTNVGDELTKAERVKVDLAIEIAERVTRFLLADDYDQALQDAQVLCTAIVHASNAAQIAARFGAATVAHAGPRQGTEGEAKDV